MLAILIIASRIKNLIMAHVIILGALFLLVTKSTAAEITESKIYDKNKIQTGSFLKFQGQIIKGDGEKLIRLIIKNSNKNLSIHLNSSGGDVKEAMILGEIIRAARLETYVQAGSTCASACFFLWINGGQRVAFSATYHPKTEHLIPASKIGLHRPYLMEIDNSEKSLRQQSQVMHKVRQYLSNLLIPNNLIDIMMSQASNEIYWLSESDLENLGESSPDLGELYLSKCKDIRKSLYKQVYAAREVGDQLIEDLLTEKIIQINDCIDDLNFSVRQNFIKNITNNNVTLR